MTRTTDLTFEAGYERLQSIAARLAEEEVPVSEMCDLFAEGKGLEQALTRYLDTQRARVAAIERGEGVQAFRIGAPAATGLEPYEFVMSRGEEAAAPLDRAGSSADDDIPF